MNPCLIFLRKQRSHQPIIVFSWVIKLNEIFLPLFQSDQQVSYADKGSPRSRCQEPEFDFAEIGPHPKCLQVRALLVWACQDCCQLNLSPFISFQLPYPYFFSKSLHLYQRFAHRELGRDFFCQFIPRHDQRER